MWEKKVLWLRAKQHKAYIIYVLLNCWIPLVWFHSAFCIWLNDRAFASYFFQFLSFSFSSNLHLKLTNETLFGMCIEPRRALRPCQSNSNISHAICNMHPELNWMQTQITSHWCNSLLSVWESQFRSLQFFFSLFNGWELLNITIMSVECANTRYFRLLNIFVHFF